MTWRNPFPWTSFFRPFTPGYQVREWLYEHWCGDNSGLMPVEHAERLRAGARYAIAKLKAEVADERLARLSHEYDMAPWSDRSWEQSAMRKAEEESMRARRVLSKMENR